MKAQAAATPPLVLDTHSWIWWVNQSPDLSATASRVLAGATPERPVVVSSISVWELFMLVDRGRLVLRTDPTHWVRQCELSPKIRFVPVDNEIARISVQLATDLGDPADRLVIATALALGGAVVTKDAKIRAAQVVRTVW